MRYYNGKKCKVQRKRELRRVQFHSLAWLISGKQEPFSLISRWVLWSPVEKALNLPGSLIAQAPMASCPVALWAQSAQLQAVSHPGSSSPAPWLSRILLICAPCRQTLRLLSPTFSCCPSIYTPLTESFKCPIFLNNPCVSFHPLLVLSSQRRTSGALMALVHSCLSHRLCSAHPCSEHTFACLKSH